MEKANEVISAFFCNSCNFMEKSDSVSNMGYCLIFKCLRKLKEECMDGFVAEAVEFKILMQLSIEESENPELNTEKKAALVKLKRPKQIAKELRKIKL